MDILKSTRQFENWLGKHCEIIPDDLAFKHAQMADSEFSFLRATFYRWAQCFGDLCPELATGPKLLGVGDLHVENFGTWRDAEGRLVWGINDFDEACDIPYANDLVRLAVSAILAVRSGRVAMDEAAVCRTIVEGYAEQLAGPAEPFVLAERHVWLAALAETSLKDPAKFWEKLSALPELDKRPPRGAVAAIEKVMPDRCKPSRWVRRVAGLGSLGKVRIVALIPHHGGAIAREAKALTPSAWNWAMGLKDDEIHYKMILRQAIRCPDPWVRVRGPWIARRLAPDCGRVDIATLSKTVQAERLLRAMARETANVHLGAKDASKKIRKDLAQLPPDWLEQAARLMLAAVQTDWKDWRAAHPTAENAELKGHPTQPVSN
jgi:hypothetical protein